MLIRDNDDATIGACYTMTNQLQDIVYNTCGQSVQKNYSKFFFRHYIIINYRIEKLIF